MKVTKCAYSFETYSSHSNVHTTKFARFKGSSYGETRAIQKQFIGQNSRHLIAVHTPERRLFKGSEQGEICAIQS